MPDHPTWLMPGSHADHTYIVAPTADEGSARDRVAALDDAATRYEAATPPAWMRTIDQHRGTGLLAAAAVGALVAVLSGRNTATIVGAALIAAVLWWIVTTVVVSLAGRHRRTALEEYRTAVAAVEDDVRLLDPTHADLARHALADTHDPAIVHDLTWRSALRVSGQPEQDAQAALARLSER